MRRLLDGGGGAARRLYQFRKSEAARHELRASRSYDLILYIEQQPLTYEYIDSNHYNPTQLLTMEITYQLSTELLIYKTYVLALNDQRFLYNYFKRLNRGLSTFQLEY